MIENNVSQEEKIPNMRTQIATSYFLQSSQQAQFPIEINKKAGYACDANSKVNEASLLMTDSIIEELKTLAKSMLDATNVARARANTLEYRRSYEVLMSAIENRTKAGLENHMISENITKLSGNTMKERHSNINTDGGASGLFSSMSALQKLSTPVPETDTIKVPGSMHKNNHVPTHMDPIAKIDQNICEPEAEHITDIPSSLSQQHPTKKHTGKEGQNTGVDHTENDSSANAFLGPEEDSYNAPQLRVDEANSLIDDASDIDEGDENVYNGVKTQTFFKSADPDAYRDIVASIWSPESFLRAEDGTIYPYVKSSSNDNGHHSHSKTEDDIYSDRSSNDDPRSGDAFHENDNSLKDYGGHAVSTIEKSKKHSNQKFQRVFRVPAFPYGGGITDDQASKLSHLFKKVVSHGFRHYHRSGDNKRTMNEKFPKFISKNDFDARNFDEVPCYAEMKPVEITSPFEFVTEVERNVVFDSLRVCEKRRQAFRQLAEKGLAPVTVGTFNLRVIMDPIKTGFEDKKKFPIVRGSIIADRYKVIQMIGKATFSRAVCCYDLYRPIYDDDDDVEDATEEAHVEDGGDGTILTCPDPPGDEGTTHSINHHGSAAKKHSKSKKEGERKVVGYAEVCLKIINNSKEFFDQSLDEIRLLTLLNTQRDPDEVHIIRLIDAFYYKEHTMLVTELLSENLYEYSKYNREEEDELYFTIPRIRRIARQVVEALAYVHSLNLMHADLKPENILFVSHRRCLVKVIDFGSSCFYSDHLSSYIQSRSYRAPEVVLGCDYDGRIDVWSLGAILFELATGKVLFSSETASEMLARIVYVCGMPFPRRMLWEGSHTCDFINKFGCIYEMPSGRGGPPARARDADADDSHEEEPCYVYTPALPPSRAGEEKEKKGSSFLFDGVGRPYSVLREKLARFDVTDESFLSFVEACLTLDHKKRPTSAELLKHEFIANETV